MATAKNEEGSFPSLHLDPGVVGPSTGGASESDLQRGFLDVKAQPATPFARDDVVHDSYGDATSADAFGARDSGFLNRPEGWER